MPRLTSLLLGALFAVVSVVLGGLQPGERQRDGSQLDGSLRGEAPLGASDVDAEHARLHCWAVPAELAWQGAFGQDGEAEPDAVVAAGVSTDDAGRSSPIGAIVLFATHDEQLVALDALGPPRQRGPPDAKS